MFEFIESFLAECKGIKNPNTIKTYRTAYNHLQAFSKYYGQNLDFADITIEFYNKYISYLTHHFNVGVIITTRDNCSLIKNQKLWLQTVWKVCRDLYYILHFDTFRFTGDGCYF